jgi:hypothetical protein
MRFHPFAEAQVLLALVLAEAPNLNQVRNHSPPGYNLNVPDRLYFSAWVKDNRTQPLLHQFQKTLERFPISKLARRGPVLRVYAIQHAEPPLLEREFPLEVPVSEIVHAARDFMEADSACEVDTYWDLWSYESGDWKLAPAAATLIAYGPDFEHAEDDHLRIEFGPDARFLPIAGVEGSLRMGQSNLRSLLHLVGELESGLDLEKRQVWSESGANFADVLRQALGQYHVN